jgi:hypothetical protein
MEKRVSISQALAILDVRFSILGSRISARSAVKKRIERYGPLHARFLTAPGGRAR